MADIHAITGITGTRVTDGRNPTLNERGKGAKRPKDLEGSIPMKTTKAGIIGGNAIRGSAGEAEINKMIDRNANSFRKDIVARSNKKKQPRHTGSCD